MAGPHTKENHRCLKPVVVFQKNYRRWRASTVEKLVLVSRCREIIVTAFMDETDAVRSCEGEKTA